MLLRSGNKLLVTHRRLFERDAPRYFVGEVLAYEDGIVKLRGFSFVRDVSLSQLVRKEDPRTKLVPLASGSFIAYVLPDDVDVSEVYIEWSHSNLLLRQGDRTLMNLAELARGGKI